MDLVFPGLRAMENIHPVVVHFPIVLLPLALLFQVLALRWGNNGQRIALWLLWLGTLGALAAATTGYWPKPASSTRRRHMKSWCCIRL